MQLIAIDSNLLLLLVIGSTSKKMIEQHKRLRRYTMDDFDLLLQFIGKAELITTPNVLTEVSNLALYGVNGKWHNDITKMLTIYTKILTEHYCESQKVTNNKNFNRLGLADSAWLYLLQEKETLLTDDLDLYLAALKSNINALYFTYMRQEAGIL
ncbi:MAG: hypothetical protein L3J67_06325 [Hyphomicrobiaceae bacterium]|nr:hypothetical protein [Hyphomicrobiaceae bacterium]